MTRLELLKIVVGQARENGFEFRGWYTKRLGLPWINADAAFVLLEAQRRYYALLFSHEFAHAFWKPGSEITFQIEKQTFQRAMKDGSVSTVTRQPFMRRSARKDVWRYHLREMALAEEPLRYIRKYLRVDEELDDNDGIEIVLPAKPPKKSTKVSANRPARPLPKDPPAFLRKPYP